MTAIDYRRYQLHLAQARGLLNPDGLLLSFADIIFDPAKHPRLRGKFTSSGKPKFTAAEHKAAMAEELEKMPEGRTMVHADSGVKVYKDRNPHHVPGSSSEPRAFYLAPPESKEPRSGFYVGGSASGAADEAVKMHRGRARGDQPTHEPLLSLGNLESHDVPGKGGYSVRHHTYADRGIRGARTGTAGTFTLNKKNRSGWLWQVSYHSPQEKEAAAQAIMGAASTHQGGGNDALNSYVDKAIPELFKARGAATKGSRAKVGDTIEVTKEPVGYAVGQNKGRQYKVHSVDEAMAYHRSNGVQVGIPHHSYKVVKRK